MTLAGIAWSNIILITIFTVGLMAVILVPFLVDLRNTHETYREVVVQDPKLVKAIGAPTGAQGAARATMAFAVIAVIGFGLAYVLVAKPLADNGKVVNTIVVALTTTLAAITAFYFGSKLASDTRRDLQKVAGSAGGAGTTPTPPNAHLKVAINTPEQGATYTLDEVVDADYSCSPSAGAEIVSLTGPVPSGTPIDTSKPGPQPFAVTAMDTNRQSVTKTNTYTVVAPEA